ncbi:MAG: replicative DNA helicase [Clostridiales bacterium]|jgi:replicative DNA helicase|nr:replicative DNA helicase [Clostridiales bacterium]
MPGNNQKDKIADHPNVRARILPHNDEAEQSVLGCVMIDQRAPAAILNELRPDDFYQGRNGQIFQAMLNLNAKTQPVDIVTLVQECEEMGITGSIGGLPYLTSLTTYVPSADNYRHYMSIVKKNSLLRQLISAARRIMEASYSGDAEDKALALAEAEVYALAEKEDKSSLVEVQRAVEGAIARMEQIYQDHGAAVGIPIEYQKLNGMLNGFHGSDLVLVAARPGQGKTSIGMNFVTHAALYGTRKTAAGKDDPYSVAVFSLEMSAEQLAKRMLCSVAKVDMKHASNGHLSTEEWTRLKDAQRRINKARIYIDDSSLTTPIEILSKCRRLKREHGLDLVLVDYLQLMSAGKRTDSRQQEVSEITRTMKIAAKELNVPILLLSQMSRDIEKRTVKTPQMSDLRESGAIEQDADIILFLHREHDPNDDSVAEDERTKTQIIIAKHRNGETGKVTVRWKGAYTTFEDLPDEDSPVKRIAAAANASRAPQGAADPPPFEPDGLIRLSPEAEVFGDTAQPAAGEGGRLTSAAGGELDDII